MRTAFLLLLLANLVLASYAFWVQSQPGPNAALMKQQIAPERIRLITPEEAERMAGGRKVSAVCYEWGAFGVADLPKAVEAIETLGVKTQERRVEEAARWWAMIPPLANRAAANARLAELKKLGVDDVGVIEDDAAGFRYGISLGLFRSEDGARTRVEALVKRGVAGARVVARESTVRVYLQVREAPDGFRGRVAELKSAWPAAELRECPTEGRG